MRANTILLTELDRFERIAVDTHKRFSYHRHTGEWSWFDADDADEMKNWHTGFETRYEALRDAIEPYLADEDDEE